MTDGAGRTHPCICICFTFNPWDISGIFELKVTSPILTLHIPKYWHSHHVWRAEMEGSPFLTVDGFICGGKLPQPTYFSDVEYCFDFKNANSGLKS